MIRILTVIGARPQIIKAAALSRAFRDHYSTRVREVIVHTGQHYDDNMSGVFFEELQIPKPDHNLNVGSGTHGKQTAAMIIGLEEIILKEKPNALVVYGDTNSTLAAGVAASKLHVPVIHIEAGLRSFNRTMPEEVNRIVCDHVSTMLFSPTKTGYDQLISEGFDPGNKAPFKPDHPGIFHCGDVMFDNSLHFAKVAEQRTDILQRLKLTKDQFILATIHRDHNTDIPENLNSLFRTLNEISNENSLDVVLPLHPRTSKMMEQNLEKDVLSSVRSNSRFRIIPPASFLEMIALEKNCCLVMTDSGGVQKEAFYFERPCVILRPQTEWVELVECGAAILADADPSRIRQAFKDLYRKKISFPKYYGDGNAAIFIAGEIVKNFA